MDMIANRPQYRMSLSPYWPGFLKTALVLGLGAVLAGHHGLAAPLGALLSNPKFNSLVLLIFSTHIALTLLLGTFQSARVGIHDFWEPLIHPCFC